MENKFKPSGSTVGDGLLCLFAGFVFQKPAAQHRYKRQRHHGRNQDGQAHDDCKFMEQQSHSSRHEEDGYQDRDQRDGDGDNRECHFARAFDGGREGRHTLFNVAHDVLQHHDGIVNHQTDRERDTE